MQMMLIMVACMFTGSHLAGVFGRHHPDRLLARGPLQGVSAACALAAPLLSASPEEPTPGALRIIHASAHDIRDWHANPSVADQALPHV